MDKRVPPRTRMNRVKVQKNWTFAGFEGIEIFWHSNRRKSSQRFKNGRQRLRSLRWLEGERESLKGSYGDMCISCRKADINFLQEMKISVIHRRIFDQNQLNFLLEKELFTSERRRVEMILKRLLIGGCRENEKKRKFSFFSFSFLRLLFIIIICLEREKAKGRLTCKGFPSQDLTSYKGKLKKTRKIQNLKRKET